MKLVEAVGDGCKTDKELAEYLDKVQRQGRYYRLAAELLGFIENKNNRSRLTELGKKLSSVSSEGQKRLLANAVLSTRIMQRVIPFLESAGVKGVSKSELERFIATVTASTIGPTMIPRRVSTITSWLSYVGLSKEIKSHYYLGPLPDGVEFLDFSNLEEPLFPRKYDLAEYMAQKEKTEQSKSSLSVLISEAKRDRASNSHKMLTNLMAKRIRKAGAFPRRNKVIDLAASISGDVFLFEMKSTTNANVQSRIRSGVAQLYEYRYLQGIKDAKLVLVIENALPKKFSWMTDYIIHDRGIYLVWDGDRKSFYCPDSLKKELGFIF